MTEAKNREKFVLGYAPRLFRTMGSGSKPLSPGSNASPAGNRGSYLETSEVMGSEWEEGGKEVRKAQEQKPLVHPTLC